jgi:hypothetical protein
MQAALDKSTSEETLSVEKQHGRTDGGKDI